MIRRTMLVITTAAMAGLVMAAPAHAVFVCPDGHLPFLVTDPNDERKDHNGNGVVCKKVNNQGQPIGGPDDTIDDIV